jgi:hypothetical protein
LVKNQQITESNVYVGSWASIASEPNTKNFLIKLQAHIPQEFFIGGREVSCDVKVLCLNRCFSASLKSDPYHCPEYIPLAYGLMKMLDRDSGLLGEWCGFPFVRSILASLGLKLRQDLSSLE